MNLSPVTILSVRSNAFPPTAKEYEHDEHGHGDVVEVVMYRCPVCRELHEWEDDAEDCCAEKRKPKESAAACPVCDAQFETHRDAADCCLWHDLDAITRWRIADAVEAGSTWAAELGIAVPA